MAECYKESIGTFASNQIGTWAYQDVPFTSPSSTVISGGKRITGMRVRADTDLTFNIDGGDTIDLKAGEIWWENPMGNVVDPTLNWLTGSGSFYVGYVT